VREGALSRDHRKDRALGALDILLRELPALAARRAGAASQGNESRLTGDEL